MSNQKCWKKIWSFVSKIFLDFYPLAFGAIIVWTRFVESTSLFFNTLFNHGHHLTAYDIDIITITIWASIILWTLINYFFKEKNEKETSKRLEQTLMAVPTFKIYEKARTYLDSCYEHLNKLRRLEEDFEKGIYEKDKITELAATLMMVGELTKRITSDFFGIKEDKIGVNYMIFFKNVGQSEKVIEKFLSENCLYFRESNEANLLGVLHLFPQLSLPILNNGIIELSIPLYSTASKIYNDSKFSNHDDITVPGAPRAFFYENSVIEDTKMAGNYEELNKQTQDEISSFFSEHMPETRSLISFRIPHESKEATSCIGVLNIETSIGSAFKKDNNEMFNSFYTLIYPTLNLVNRHLCFYGNYQINALQ